MRRRYYTSNNKLSAIIFIIAAFPVYSKKELKDNNITCYAANNKWVCSKKEHRQEASKEAAKIIKDNNYGFDSSEVIIKSVHIPNFNIPNETITDNSEEFNLVANKRTIIKPMDNNPYVKLWSHQLIGLSSPQSAINFVTSKKLNKEDILIVKSKRDNMDWWIILYGLYKDKQTGLDNEQGLPATIKEYWLRPLKTLQINGFIEKY